MRHSICDSYPHSPQAGEPIVDQLVFAAKKAFISGEFQPGQNFPSVRAPARDFAL
jgi:DNA-binding transcriptional regulator YhcF (GntR family)